MSKRVGFFDADPWLHQPLTTALTATNTRHKKAKYGDRDIPLLSTINDFAKYQLTSGFDLKQTTPYQNILLSVSKISTGPILKYSSQEQRRIPSPASEKKVSLIPMKSLHAPGLHADFYMHLLDWSMRQGQSFFVVALDSSPTSTTVYGSSFIADSINTESMSNVHSLYTAGEITSLRLYVDSLLTVGTNHGQFSFIDMETKATVVSYHTVDANRISCIASMPLQRVVLTGTTRSSIYMFDQRQKTALAVLPAHEKSICNVVYNHNFHEFATGGDDNEVHVWDLRKLGTQPLFQGVHQAAVRALNFSPAASHLLASGGGTKDHFLRIYDIANQKLLCARETGSQITNVYWSSDGKKLVTTHGFSENRIKVWGYDPHSEVQLHLIQSSNSENDRIIQGQQSPDGEFIAGASGNLLHFWKVWDLPKSKPIPPVNRWIDGPITDLR